MRNYGKQRSTEKGTLQRCATSLLAIGDRSGVQVKWQFAFEPLAFELSSFYSRGAVAGRRKGIMEMRIATRRHGRHAGTAAQAAATTLALQKIQNLIFGDFWLGKFRISAKNQNKNQNFACRLCRVLVCSGALRTSTWMHLDQ